MTTHAKRTSLRTAWKTQPAAPARGLLSKQAASDKLRPIRSRVSGKLRLKPTGDRGDLSGEQPSDSRHRLPALVIVLCNSHG
jgi:hypothetical protein